MGARASNSSFELELSGNREVPTVDSLEVDDCGVTAEVEDVFSDSEIARAASLLAGEVGKRMFNLHALAEPLAAL